MAKMLKSPTGAKKPASEKKPAPSKPTKEVSPGLSKLIDGLNRKYGDGAITLGSSAKKRVDRIPTGSFSLDLAIGGGIPVGRYTEISGALSTSKTTQTLHIVRNAQEAGYVCAYVDVEGTTDRAYMLRLGIDADMVLYSTPGSMEEALQSVLDMQQSGEVHLAVIDSIAALSSNKEQESGMEDVVRMGITQQLLGEFFRKYQMNNNKLTREGKRPFTLIGINQLREKIGGYGDPEYTPGGRAKGFTASLDFRLRRGEYIKEGSGQNESIVGVTVKFKIAKNKTFKALETGEFDFYFDENNAGVPACYNDTSKEVITAAVEWGVITKSGAWFMYNDVKYQGLDKLVKALQSDQELVDDLKAKVMYLSTPKEVE